MTPTIEELARGLTEAQKRAVMTNDSGFADRWKGHWHCLSIVTARKLFASGLIDRRDNLARPTPLGLTLRAYLEKTHG